LDRPEGISGAPSRFALGLTASIPSGLSHTASRYALALPALWFAP